MTRVLSKKTMAAITVLSLVGVGLTLGALWWGEVRGPRAGKAGDEGSHEGARRRVVDLLHRSRSLIALKRHAEAEAVLKKALRVAVVEGLDVESRKVQVQLGELYRLQGKHRLAERVLEASIRTRPPAGSPRTAYCPYTALGELYTALEGHQQADDRSALSPARSLAAALESFAGNRFADARRHLARARVKGEDARRKVLLGFILLLEKKYTLARARFQQAQKLEPRQAGAQVGLGHLAIIRKDYPAAGALLHPFVAPSHEPVGAHAARTYRWLVWRMARLGMGWIAANQNRHPEAIKHFDRVLSHNRGDLFALLGKGNSLSALSLLEQAEATLGQALKLDPGNKYAMAELALVMHNRGQDAQAERLFKAALKLDPRRYTCPHEGLGLIYLRAGKLDQARASFRKAIAINPNIEYRKFNGLARILIGEGNYAGARKLLRQSMKNHAFDPTARKLLNSIKGK